MSDIDPPLGYYNDSPLPNPNEIQLFMLDLTDDEGPLQGMLIIESLNQKNLWYCDLSYTWGLPHGAEEKIPEHSALAEKRQLSMFCNGEYFQIKIGDNLPCSPPTQGA